MYILAEQRSDVHTLCCYGTRSSSCQLQHWLLRHPKAATFPYDSSTRFITTTMQKHTAFSRNWQQGQREKLSHPSTNPKGTCPVTFPCRRAPSTVSHFGQPRGMWTPPGWPHQAATRAPAPAASCPFTTWLSVSTPPPCLLGEEKKTTNQTTINVTSNIFQQCKPWQPSPATHAGCHLECVPEWLQPAPTGRVDAHSQFILMYRQTAAIHSYVCNKMWCSPVKIDLWSKRVVDEQSPTLDVSGRSHFTSAQAEMCMMSMSSQSIVSMLPQPACQVSISHSESSSHVPELPCMGGNVENEETLQIFIADDWLAAIASELSENWAFHRVQRAQILPLSDTDTLPTWETDLFESQKRL